MPKVDDFNLQYTASSVNARGFVATKQIPAGSKLVIAVGCTGAAAGVTVTDTRSNSFITRVSIVNAGVTCNAHIVTCFLTNTIQIGDTITFTLAGGATSQRWNVAFAWFDDIDTFAAPGIASQEQSSQFASSSTITKQFDYNITFGVACFTGAGDPAVATSGATLICSMITTAGSAERGMAFSYEYDSAASRSATFTLAASAAVVTAGATFDATNPTPPVDTGNTASDNVIDTLANAGFSAGSLRDRQMAQHIAAGRVTGSYKDRCVVAGNPSFPR